MGRFSIGPVPNVSKRQPDNANLGSPVPLSGKATQGSQSESCSGGSRCKGPSEKVDRRRLGWTVPPEKSRGIRGGLALRQRTGVGRIRSCCQGWTRLDDCCEERGHVAPGGREGSGRTR